jgi:NAD(P)-dependent dehydrogenase (short-subunit alcohol dehydrogenase family)
MRRNSARGLHACMDAAAAAPTPMCCTLVCISVQVVEKYGRVDVLVNNAAVQVG